MTNNETPLEQLTFREAMSELDRITTALDSNTLELEDSLATYERGIKILSMLNARMAEAKQKVTVLMGELVAPADDATTDTTLS